MTNKPESAAAIYVRWNSAKKPESYRDEQIRQCYDRARQLGLGVKVEHVYVDDSDVGLRARQSMLDALEKRRFDVLIVTELSRLGRDFNWQHKFIQTTLAESRARLVCLDGVDTQQMSQALDDCASFVLTHVKAREAAVRSRRHMVTG